MREKSIYSAAVPVYIKVECRQGQYWIHWNYKGKRKEMVERGQKLKAT